MRDRTVRSIVDYLIAFVVVMGALGWTAVEAAFRMFVHRSTKEMRLC